MRAFRARKRNVTIPPFFRLLQESEDPGVTGKDAIILCQHNYGLKSGIWPFLKPRTFDNPVNIGASQSQRDLGILLFFCILNFFAK